MRQCHRLLVACLLGLALPLHAASLSLTAASASTAGLRAEGLVLEVRPQGALHLELRSVGQGKSTLARQLSVDCAALQIAGGRARCVDGRFAASTTSGPLRGELLLQVQHLQSAGATLNALWAGQKAVATVAVDAEQATIKGGLPLDLTALLKLPALSALLPAGATATGTAELKLQARATASTQNLDATLEGAQVTLGEASGRYATDKLDFSAKLVTQRPGQWLAAAVAPLEAELALQLHKGQVYAEPVFVDLATAPLLAKASFKLAANGKTLGVEHFTLSQKSSFQASGSATLALQPLALTALKAKLDDARLPDFYDRYVVPFLAGKPGEDSKTTGSVSGQLEIAAGKPLRGSLVLDKVGIEAKRLDAGLVGVSGTLAWTAAGTATEPTRLSWKSARIGKLGLPAATLIAEAQGDQLRLLAPFRQGILDGALRIDALQLRELGAASPSAQVKAEVEPIDLKALTAALGWPQFSGQLGGKLPGLSYTNNTLALQGALTAQAFDGNISIENLRWVEPLARSRRLTADITLRRIDLTQLTGAFSYGRIDGRIDGEVKGLKLLGFKPIAFDARIYTSPSNPGKRRISQRAINNISSLGGGPSALLSKSVLRFFEDFAYSRLGFSCVLKDNVCQMGGIGPAKDGGYVLVEGSLIPRIDVVGHSSRVDWDTFYNQLVSLRDLQAPTTGVNLGQ